MQTRIILTPHQGNTSWAWLMQGAEHFLQGEDNSLGFSPSCRDWVNIYKPLNPLQWPQRFPINLNHYDFMKQHVLMWRSQDIHSSMLLIE